MNIKESVFRGENSTPLLLSQKMLNDEGEFEGYAATYGNVDKGGDIIVAGAFDESLRARPAKKIKMLVHHDTTKIVGTWDSAESDATGLYVKGKLILKTQLGRETHELLLAGALDAMSIGYVTKEENTDRMTGIRELNKVSLQEISIVPFPMNDQAMVMGVKSFSELVTEIQSLSDAEKLLREAEGGFSRKEAVAFVSKVKRIAQREAADNQGVTDALTKLTQLLRG